MKREDFWKALFVVLLLAGALGAWLMRPAPAPAPAPAVIIAPAAGDLTLTTFIDPKLVFQKAFWRRPANDDVLLHAERREWTSPADGIRKWQWFIALKPGQSMRAWLKTNPFLLASAAPPNATNGFPQAPSWYPAASPDFEIQRAARTPLTLMFSADGNTLYATDAGMGFGLPNAAPP